ncbi:MAG: hypothetical protein ACK4SO_04715 [Candidatus Kapaibacteriota bacterium]
MKYIWLVFAFCVVFVTNLICEIYVPSNKEVTQQLLKEFTDSLSRSLARGKYWLFVSSNPLSDLVEANVVSRLSAKEYQFYTFLCDSCTNLSISVNNFDIDYKRIRRDRPTNQIIRKVELNITALIKPPNSIVETFVFKRTFQDTLTSDQLDAAERDGVPFTAPKPKGPENFFKKYFEPLIIIASTSLALFLFFTVRAK